MDKVQVSASENCKRQFTMVKEEICVMEDLIKRTMDEYLATSPKEPYIFEMEKVMDKLALLAAYIHDKAHGKETTYNIYSERYQRSMQRRMRKALGMYDALDKEGSRNKELVKVKTH
jgi:hypothetical protein